METGKALVTLDELYKEPESLEKVNALNMLLNQPPKPSWIKEHPQAKREVVIDGQKRKVPYLYIPIERVEWLLTRIFIQWKREIISYSLLGNSVCAHVRLHVKNPVTNEWEFHDGVGAVPLQTDSGAGAIEFDKLKTMSVQMALPAAASFAVKDAADNFGKIFGKDLNRIEEIAYDNLANFNRPSVEDKIEIRKKISAAIDVCQDEEFKNKIIDKLVTAESSGLNSVEFYTEILNELEGK